MSTKVTNKRVFASSIMAGITACIHFFIGTNEIMSPIFNSEISQSNKILLLACWHLVTVTLFMSCYSLYKLSKMGNSQNVNFSIKQISGMWIAFGAIFIVLSVYYSGFKMLLDLPQWILLIPTGSVGLSGIYNKKN
jgi:hypothetical protein